MFGIRKSKLVKSLNKIGTHLCAYSLNGKDQPVLCDCKYMLSNNDMVCVGENSGCPELKLVAHLLSKLTEKQFEALCKKAKVI